MENMKNRRVSQADLEAYKADNSDKIKKPTQVLDDWKDITHLGFDRQPSRPKQKQ